MPNRTCGESPTPPTMALVLVALFWVHSLAASPSDAPSYLLYEEHFGSGVESITVPIPPRVFVKPDSSTPAKIAVIIDDLGYNGKISQAMAKLPADITLAILPGAPHARLIAELGAAHGKEILLHQPMEPLRYPAIHSGPGSLLTGMSKTILRQTLLDNLKQLPEAVGVNNHMGSRLTSNRSAMETVMRTLREENLFFIDSRTSSDTVAYEEAVRQTVPTAMRDIFLDNRPEEKAIFAQLEQLRRVAGKQGYAIGIGHPYPETLSALSKWLATIASQKEFSITRASRLVDLP